MTSQQLFGWWLALGAISILVQWRYFHKHPHPVMERVFEDQPVLFAWLILTLTLGPVTLVAEGLWQGFLLAVVTFYAARNRVFLWCVRGKLPRPVARALLWLIGARTHFAGGKVTVHCPGCRRALACGRDSFLAKTRYCFQCLETLGVRRGIEYPEFRTAAEAEQWLPRIQELIAEREAERARL